MRPGCALILAFALTGATHRPAPVAFADLSRLLALHPLHKVLEAYDREIAALRLTLTFRGLDDPATRVQQSVAALARESAAAQGRIERIPSNDAASDRVRERSAIVRVLASQHGSDRAMNAYRSELARATEANLRGFSAAIAARNQRALAARRQQLHEKELTLGYDLARRDAGERLLLRVRLADLHLDRAKRGGVQARLSEIGRRQAAAVAGMRRVDDAILAAYAAQLQSQGVAADSAMIAQLRSKAAANLALRFRVLQTESRFASVLPDLPARVDWFASTYHFSTDAAAIVAGLRGATTDISQRFAQVAAGDRSSRTQTGMQIARLQDSRGELYRSIVAQIVGAARRMARERHLGGVVLSGSRPQHSIDLTRAIRAELANL
jgi:hypothetical protein